MRLQISVSSSWPGPPRHAMSLLLALLLLSSAPTLVIPVAATVEAAPATPPPALTAQSAVLMQVDTGEVLWSLDQAARHSMASTAKMMTALVTIGLADLEEIAVVDASHLAVWSTAGLQAGEQISIHALLQALLIPSDNAAGLVLADYVGRTYLAGGPNMGVKAFVQAMNKRAQQMGLTNTHYESPFGDKTRQGTYSSAYDLAQVGRAVLQEPWLAPIVATCTARVTGSLNHAPVEHHLVTTNRHLWAYPGTYGVKTGWNAWADEVLVASNRQGATRLLAVVMGAADSFADTAALFRWGYAQLGETAPAVTTCQAERARIPDPGTWGQAYDRTSAGGPIRAPSLAGALPASTSQSAASPGSQRSTALTAKLTINSHIC
jgi:D-alanyl-D-alanine carboxypeptidase